jgi:hypothetical protein
LETHKVRDEGATDAELSGMPHAVSQKSAYEICFEQWNGKT